MSKIDLKVISIWLLSCIFSFVQFFLQIMPNIFAEAFQHSLKLSPVSLSLLSSAFFYPFLCVQIPAAYLFKRYGIHCVLGCAVMGTAIGNLLLAASHTLVLACFARLIAGAGAGFGFLGMLLLIKQLFPQRFFSLLVGISEFLALGLTALSENIFAHLPLTQHWRLSMLVIGLLLCLLSFLMFIFIPQFNTSQEAMKINKHLFTIIKKTLSDPFIIAAAFAGLGLFAIVTAFSALWGFTFLKNYYQYTSSLAGTGIGLLFWGLAIGCPLIGLLNAYLQKPITIMVLSSIVTTIFTSLLLFLPIHTSSVFILTLLFLIGFFCAPYYLSYDIIMSVVEPKTREIVLGFTSMLIMSGAIFLQPFISFLLEKFTLFYPLSKSIQLANTPLLVVQCAAVLSSFYILKALKNAKNSTKL